MVRILQRHVNVLFFTGTLEIPQNNTKLFEISDYGFSHMCAALIPRSPLQCPGHCDRQYSVTGYVRLYSVTGYVRLYT